MFLLQRTFEKTFSLTKLRRTLAITTSAEKATADFSLAIDGVEGICPAGEKWARKNMVEKKIPMTKGNISVTKDTSATEIIRLLQSQHLIRVAVVDAQGKLLGVVARRDILLGHLRSTKPIWTF